MVPNKAMLKPNLAYAVTNFLDVFFGERLGRPSGKRTSKLAGASFDTRQPVITLIAVALQNSPAKALQSKRGYRDDSNCCLQIRHLDDRCRCAGNLSRRPKIKYCALAYHKS